ncbi:MAG: ACT domain-containing protein [Acidobacteriia bacterium]|nr:ACT domain-containing protein [Terriglobia bacterium]
MRLAVIQGEFGAARLDANEATPAWATQGLISSVTRTDEELSVVCDAGAIPPGVKAERGWRCLRVMGRLEFSLTGILASIVGPLAAAKVSIFAISTYDTDYVLVPGEAMGRAIESLRAAGHEVLGA